MPLYEYSCGACGAVSEISHRMSAPAPTDCPACGAPELSKQISAASFRLKGAGWYETDFKSEGKKNIAGDSDGDSKPDPKPDPKADTKTETKSEIKADTKSEGKSETKPEAKKSESKPAPTAGGGSSGSAAPASPAG